MATVKLGHTGSSSRLISYCEKRAVEKEGVSCDHEYAKSQFRTTQELHNKGNGVQAYHVIQSFKPGEVDSKKANQIGLVLAEMLSKGHEAVIYTHADKDHIHNHIVINAVHPDTGKKFQLHGKEAIERVRTASDDICKRNGLSVVKEPTAEIRYTLAEKSIIEKGGSSWKDEIREAIDLERVNSKNYTDFKNSLAVKHGITVNDSRKHITYKHPDHAKVVRGNKLGLNYERSTIEHGFSRQAEKEQLIERARKQLKDSRASIADTGTIINDSATVIRNLNTAIRDAQDAISADESERRDRIAQEESFEREQDRARDKERLERERDSYDWGYDR